MVEWMRPRLSGLFLQYVRYVGREGKAGEGDDFPSLAGDGVGGGRVLDVLVFLDEY